MKTETSNSNLKFILLIMKFYLVVLAAFLAQVYADDVDRETIVATVGTHILQGVGDLVTAVVQSLTNSSNAVTAKIQGDVAKNPNASAIAANADAISKLLSDNHDAVLSTASQIISNINNQVLADVSPLGIEAKPYLAELYAFETLFESQLAVLGAAVESTVQSQIQLGATQLENGITGTAVATGLKAGAVAGQGAQAVAIAALGAQFLKDYATVRAELQVTGITENTLGNLDSELKDLISNVTTSFSGLQTTMANNQVTILAAISTLNSPPIGIFQSAINTIKSIF